MNESTQKQLEEAGIDVIKGLRIFSGISSLYSKYLLKFMDDKSFENARTAFDEQDMKALEFHVHALKGVAGNLGMVEIYHLCTDIVTALRAEDSTEAQKGFPKLERAYDIIWNTLNAVRGDLT